MLAPVEAYASVNVTVDASYGLLAPPQGIFQNRDCMQVRTAAVDGAVPWTRALAVPPVGAVWNTSLSFDEPEPGRATGVWVRSTLNPTPFTLNPQPSTLNPQP